MSRQCERRIQPTKVLKKRVELEWAHSEEEETKRRLAMEATHTHTHTLSFFDWLLMT